VSVIAKTPSARARRAAQAPRARAEERHGLLPAIVGLGAGGHAKCAIEAIRSVLRYRVVALLDSDPSLQGRTVLGCPVVAGFRLPAIVGAGAGVIDDVAPGVRMGGVPARPLTSPRTTR
jgi:FlaA1/EpsC-like NDP-sugar epimerase